VLGFLKTPADDIGRYSLASNFGNYFYSISSAMSTALNPFVLKDIRHAQLLKVRSLVFMAQLLLMSMTFLFSLWSKEVLNYLIRNDELKMVYPMVIIIVMAFSYRPMYIGATSVLFFYEKTNDLVKISFIAGLANVLLNIFLIPKFGYSFAAYSTFICYMYVGYSGYFLKQFKRHVEVDFFPLVWLMATVLLTVLAYFAVELNIILKIVISIFMSTAFLLGMLQMKRKYEQ
jgi:O-antigen/teichoic acid export membrane protein